jgi:hypothetical protein
MFFIFPFSSPEEMENVKHAMKNVKPEEATDTAY